MADCTPDHKRPATPQGQIGSLGQRALSLCRGGSGRSSTSIAFPRPTSPEEPERVDIPEGLGHEVKTHFNEGGAPVPFLSGGQSPLRVPLPSSHAHTLAVLLASPTTPESADSPATTASTSTQPSTDSTSPPPTGAEEENASNAGIDATPAASHPAPGLDPFAAAIAHIHPLRGTVDSSATQRNYYDAGAWGEAFPSLNPRSPGEAEVAVEPRFRTLDWGRGAPIFFDGEAFGAEEAAWVLTGMRYAEGEAEVEEIDEGETEEE